MKSSDKKVTYNKEKLRAFCIENRIKRLSLFGSVLRDDFSDESDIDILVEFEAGHVPGFFKLYDLENELSGFFDGRKIDLRTPEDLSRYFREDVINNMSVEYETR